MGFRRTRLEWLGFQVKRWENNQWSATYSGITANGGFLGFTQVPLNRYQISEVLQPGWSASTAATQEINVDQNGLYTVTFGNYQLITALGDYVWYDLNSNGIQDETDTGVAQVRVNLLNAAGNVVATKTTDSQGRYLFDNLTPWHLFGCF